MERIIPKDITVKEFEQNWTIKTGSGMIEGRPKYNVIYKVQKAVRENLTRFSDQHEPTYGRLYLILNTVTLPGCVAIAASVNQ